MYLFKEVKVARGNLFLCIGMDSLSRMVLRERERKSLCEWSLTQNPFVCGKRWKLPSYT